MFGNKKKLEEELRREGGVVAWATITNVVNEWDTAQIDQFNQVAARTDHVKITVSVQPDDAAPFTATFRQAFSGARPFEDWQCKVIYDPKDTSRIAVLEASIAPPGMDHARAEMAADIRADAMAAAASGNIAQFVQDLQARAMSGQFNGTPVMDPAAMGLAGQPGATPGAVPGAMPGGMPAIPGVDPAALAQAMAQAEAFARAMKDVPIGPNTDATTAAGMSTVIDQLTKLADLHDRGVLTDEEFAAQKAKLLADK